MVIIKDLNPDNSTNANNLYCNQNKCFKKKTFKTDQVDLMKNFSILPN